MRTWVVQSTYVINLLTKLGEVRRQDGGRDEVVLAAPNHLGSGARRDANRRLVRAKRQGACRRLPNHIQSWF
jgi:hypothetical protein